MGLLYYPSSSSLLAMLMLLIYSLLVFGAGEYFVSGQDVDQLTPEGQVLLHEPSINTII